MKESKIRYLEMVQLNIERMFRASFAYKSLAVTAVTATLGAAVVSSNDWLIPLALLPLLLFWFLDGYHLEVERRYRRLYARALAEDQPSFSMIPLEVEGSNSTIVILKTIFSPTLSFLYIPILLIIGLWIVLVLC